MFPRASKSLLAKLAFLFALCACRSSGQVYPFHLYTSRDGLVCNQVTTLFQESRGYLWVGTPEGLSVFDGIVFRNFTTKDGLTANSVNCFFESSRMPGTIWIGTNGGGISKYSDGKFVTYNLDSLPQARNVNAILEDHDGTIWCATDAGAYLIRDAIPVRLAAGAAFSLVESSNHRIWVSNGKQLTVYSREHDNISARNPIVPSEALLVSLVADSGGAVWALSQGGVIYNFRDSGRVDSIKLPAAEAGRIDRDHDGNLYVTTAQGLFFLPRRRVDATEVRRFTIENGLSENYVLSACVDREENLWIGTYSSGLLKLSERNVYAFPTDLESNPSSPFFNVIDSSHHLWALMEHSVMEIWSASGRWYAFQHTAEEFGVDVRMTGMALDRSGNLWVCFDNSFFRQYSLTARDEEPSVIEEEARLTVNQDSLSGPHNFFIIDHNNILWTGVWLQGLAAVDLSDPNHEQQIYKIPEGSIGNTARALFEDRDGILWLGDYSSGLTRFRKDHMVLTDKRTYTIADGLPSNSIRALSQDRSGKLWVGTRFGGLAWLEGDKFHSTPSKEILQSEGVWDFTDDGAQLWVATNNGLRNVRLADSVPVGWNNQFMGTPVYSCGLYGERFLWFRTAKAVTFYDYSRSSRTMVRPPVYITHLKFGGKEMPIAAWTSVPYDEDNCTIGFVGITFAGDKGSRYRYRLVGADDNWRQPTYERAVNYAALAPGEYTFEVVALTDDGVESAQPASITFTVSPPYWRRWWFYLLIGIGIGFVFYRTYIFRLKKVEKETLAQQAFSKQLIESQERERKRIASELHDGIGQNFLIIKNRAVMGMNAVSDNEETLSQLREISDIASESINEVREISYNLRPYQLDRLGLTKSLESIIEKISPTSRTSFTADIDNIDNVFAKDSEINIYRIVQEALNNAIKHSNAQAVFVKVSRNDSQVEIAVEDDGRGFDPPKAAASQSDGSGGGLRDISERVRILGGTMNIHAALSRGTRLNVQLPIKHHE